MFWYQVADVLLTIVHVGVTLFNLTGWAFRNLRRLHLTIVLLTLASWVIPGIFYGFGYCFLTDWQWAVKRRLGEQDLPDSFIKYALDALFNADIPATIVDIVTVAGLVFALIMTWIRNKDLLRRKA